MSYTFEQLISGAKSDAPRADLLETLGKKAAAQYLQNDVPLNESIVKLASEYANLNNEHLKRIAEFANNSVFQEMHSRDADKNVHFDIADPGVIIRDLRDGGSPAHDGKTLNAGLPASKRSYVPTPSQNQDYQGPPPNTPNTDGFADVTSGMAELSRQDGHTGLQGAGEPIAKVASAGFEGLIHANPIDDIFDTTIRLRATREKLAATHENFDFALKSAKQDFYGELKKIALDQGGEGLMGVVNAVKLASPNDSFAFAVMKPMVERLVEEGALRESQVSGLQKVASQKIVNLRHPIMVAYAGIMKMAEEKVRSKEALRQVDEALDTTSAWMKANLQ
jgi:hypothetical protein